MAYFVEVQTKRFLRKPLIEGFLMHSKTEDETKSILNKYRPNVKLICLIEVQVLSENKIVYS
jgi:hypothetical protein